MQPTQDDCGDIREALQGDEHAFARIITRHQEWLSLHMWRFTREPAVLRELVHDTFVEVYFSLRGYKQKGSFAGWIRTIGTRVGYRYWKQQSRARMHQTLDDTCVAELPHGKPESPDEASEILFSLLERLPTDDRVVLTLHYFDEMDMKEIARQLGWTVTYVKVRAHRARKKLRALFEAQEDTP